MAAGSRVPGGAASNFDSWLRRCEGFRVDSPHGRVGFVEEVRYASRLDRPDVIAVRTGRLGRPLLIVPVAEIAQMLPQEERIVLHRSPRPTATERPKDLRRHAQPGVRRIAADGEAEGVPAGATRIEAARREVKAVIKRLTRLIGLRFGRGGEREMTPDIEPSAESPAEEPPAEEEAREEPAAEEAPAEEAAEGAPTEEPAAEEPPAEPAAEEPPAEEPPPEEPPAEGRTPA
jgi:hypothetical protein